VVYLPAAPVESASRLAGAITDLGNYLGRQVTGLTLDVRAFRRAEDVAGFLQGSGSEIALLVADAALLHDLPPSVRILPLYRFSRDGRETVRKIIVARDPAVTSIRDLRGKRLAVAYGSGRGASAFLTQAVFGGEIAPDKWFSALVHESDDLSATASVLFDRADAALVSEGNPLVASHLGKDLHQVFTSAPISLPVIAIREGALNEAQQSAVRRALADMSGNAEGQKILASLGLDGLRTISEADRLAVLRLPSPPERALEIAVPAMLSLAPGLLSPLKPDQLPYVVGLPIIDAPLPTITLDAGSKRTPGSQ
jgi:ABC-type phosphate/phosphonate transport system substrate-binding protein